MDAAEAGAGGVEDVDATAPYTKRTSKIPSLHKSTLVM